MNYSISNNHPLAMFANNHSILDLDVFNFQAKDLKNVEEAMKYVTNLPHNVVNAIMGLDYLQLLNDHTAIFDNLGTRPLNVTFNPVVSKHWFNQLGPYEAMSKSIALKVSLYYEDEIRTSDIKIYY